MIKDAPHTRRLITPWRAACLATLLISGLVYLPAMSGLAIWDDNALIGGGKSLAECFTKPFLLHYFRPLVSVSFFVDRTLFGSGPVYYHQTNLIIHVLTTLICLHLFKAAFNSKVVAVAGALLFAVQPAQVSTVAWIGGRTDSLCTLWAALYALALVRSAQSWGKRRTRWAALATAAFGLAIFTKEQALGLLPLAPFAFRCFAPAPPSYAWRDGLRHWVPFLVTTAAFVAMWCVFYPAPLRPVIHSAAAQAALAGRTLTCYSALLAFPTPAAMHLLSVVSLERWGIWTILPGYAALAAVVALCVTSLRRRPAVAFFCAFVLAGILPVSNLVPIPSLVVAPYRVGLCGPAAAALLAYAFAYACYAAYATAKRTLAAEGMTIRSSATMLPSLLWRQSRGACIQTAAGAAMAVWCCALTCWGARQWQDECGLFSTIVRYDPDSIVARCNLTSALLRRHRTEPALVELDDLMTRLFGSHDWMSREGALGALKRDPEILVRVRENEGGAVNPEQWLARLYAQIGFAELSCERRAEARRNFAIGYSIDRTDDDVNLGLAQMAYDEGSIKDAIGHLRVVIAASPRRAQAHMLLGHALAAVGQWRKARQELETWSALQPWSGQAYVEVAQARSRLGDYRGTIASLQYALSHSICDVQEVRARLSDVHGRAARFLN
jgi:protein O-mannosyl-transferase